MLPPQFPNIEPVILLDYVNGNRVMPKMEVNRNSSVRYSKSTGFQWRGPNTPVIEKDLKTGEPLGLRSEKEATNYYLNSDFSNVSLGTYGGANSPDFLYGGGSSGLTATITSVGVSDVGLPYIDIRLQGTYNGSQAAVLYLKHTILPDTTTVNYTASAYAKRITGNQYQTFSLMARHVRNDGTYAGSARLDVENIDNWSRLHATPGLVDNNYNHTELILLIYFQIGEVVDNTVRISTPQIEVGYYPTSIISTSASVVTKHRDSQVLKLDKTLKSFTFYGEYYQSSNYGAIYGKYESTLACFMPSDDDAGKSIRLMSASVADDFTTPIGLGMTVRGHGALISNVAPVPGSIRRFTGKYNSVTGEYRCFENGVELPATNGNFGTTGLEFTKLYVGCDAFDGYELGGHVRRLYVWDEFLTDQQCIDMSK